MNRTARIAAIVVAVLAAIWCGVWFYVQSELRRQTLAWIDQQRAQGTTVEHGALSISGFPVWWRIEFESPRIAATDPSRGEWRGTRAAGIVRPWAFRVIPLRFEGEQHLTVGDGQRSWTITTLAAEPDAQITLGSNGRLERVDADMQRYEVRGPADVGTYRGERATVAVKLYPAPASHMDPLVDVTATLIDLDLPRPPVPGLATRVQRFDLDGSFRGRLPPGRLAEAIAAWRDDGGTIEINRLVLVSAPVDFDGSGTLALDNENRALGAFSGRLRGYTETIDALARAGTIAPMAAIGLRLFLTGIQRQGQDGRYEVRVAITAQDGMLSVNDFRLPGIRLLPLRFQ